MFDFKRFLHTLKTTKRFTIPLFVIVFLAVYGLVIVMPKKYQSSAQVLIHEPKLTNIVGQSAGVLDINDRLQTIREEMTSFPFLSEIARKLNLGKGLSPDSQDYERLVRRMQSSIDLRIKNRDLFTVAYSASTPQEARDVTNEIVNLYISRNSQYYERRTNETSEFLSRELETAERAHRMAQEEVTKYKEQFPKEIPEVQQSQLQRLNQLRNEKETSTGNLQGGRATLSMLRDRLSRTPAEIVSQSTVQAGTEKATLERNKKTLESNLTLMLQDFTEEHWQVKQLRQQIAQLDKEIGAIQENPTTSETRTPNPAHQALLDQITQVEMTVQQNESNIAKMNQEIAQLETWQSTMPKRQLELNRLEGALRAQSERVDLLRKRLNEAQTAANIEERGQGPSFELSDPPRLNLDPVAPNPKKFLVMGLGLGGACAFALVYLLMLLDNAVRSVDEARKMLQMPVLGVVQRVITRTEELRQARRRKLRMWGAGLGTVMLLCVIGLGMTVLREPLRQEVESIRAILSERLK